MPSFREPVRPLDLLLSGAAFFHRRLHRGTRLVAVTGSAGKSTTKELLGAILASRYPTNLMLGTDNQRGVQVRTVLRTRRHHQFTVMEVGTISPGSMRRSSVALDPDVVVVLNVLPMHSNHFPTLELMAREKASLLRRLTGERVAVLNNDNPWTRAMRDGLRAAVWTFGESPEADVWSSNVEAVWPGRLSFDIHFRDATRRVATQLVGEHWAEPVLAAICAGLACGIDLESAVRAVERVLPTHGRLEPVALPCGAVMLRDDYNASVTTYRPALRVIETAQGARRVAVVGDTWDSGLPEQQRLEQLGTMVAAAADVALFVGPGCEVTRQAALAAGMPPTAAHACATQEEAAALLRSELRRGDLVLLKGQWIRHLERVYWAQLGTVFCQRAECELLVRCEDCKLLGFVPGDR